MGKFLPVPKKTQIFLGYQNCLKTSVLWSLGVVPYLSACTPSTHNENHMHSKSGEIFKPDLKTSLKQGSALYSSLVWTFLETF